MYLDANEKMVDEFNRRTRFHCAEEFVSWKGETKAYWFEELKAPEGKWENSAEAKASAAQGEERDKAIARLEEEFKNQALTRLEEEKQDWQNDIDK